MSVAILISPYTSLFLSPPRTSQVRAARTPKSIVRLIGAGDYPWKPQPETREVVNRDPTCRQTYYAEDIVIRASSPAAVLVRQQLSTYTRTGAATAYSLTHLQGKETAVRHDGSY